MQTLIIDLDNTIYPVSSIAEKLFAPVFELLKKPEFKLKPETIEKAKQDIQRIPFQKVAEKYQLPGALTSTVVEILRNTSYNEVMHPFEDYQYVKNLPIDRFLLTSGFFKLQQSKVKQLNIEDDFKEIFILDPETTKDTKKEFIEKIIKKYNLDPENILIVGDDPDSEIKAAHELGIKSFLLDKQNRYEKTVATYRGHDLKQVQEIIAGYQGIIN